MILKPIRILSRMRDFNEAQGTYAATTGQLTIYHLTGAKLTASVITMDISYVLEFFTIQVLKYVNCTDMDISVDFMIRTDGSDMNAPGIKCV